MAKKTTVSPAANSEHLRLKDEMIQRVTAQIKGQNWSDTDLSKEELVMIEMAVGSTLGDLGITLPFNSVPPAAPSKQDANMLAGAGLALMAYSKVTDDFLDRLLLDNSHSETSIVSLPEHGGIILTKPLARMILALRMTLAEE